MALAFGHETGKLSHRGRESTGDALLERRSDQRERAEPEALDVARRRIQRKGAAAAVPNQPAHACLG